MSSTMTDSLAREPLDAAITIRLPRDVKDSIVSASAEHGWTVNEWMRRLIGRGLEGEAQRRAKESK